jgi:hypothetical protein
VIVGTDIERASVRVYEGWTSAPPQLWSAPAAHPFSSRAWLMNADPSVTVLTIEDGTTPLGLGILRSVSGFPLHCGYGLLVGDASAAMMRAAGHAPSHLDTARRADWSTVAVSMSPSAYRSAVVGHRSSERLHALLTEVSQRAGDDGTAAIVFPYLRQDSDAQLLDALASLGAVVHVQGGGYRLEVIWSSLPDYFADLGKRSRSLRRGYQRQAAGDRFTQYLAPDTPVPAAISRPMARLFADSAGRHGDHSPPSALYRAALGRWPGPRVAGWTVDRATGTPGCGVLAFDDGSGLIPKFYGETTRAGEYLQLGYTAMVKQAVDLGRNFVDWGGGSPLPKLFRGAELYWILCAVLFIDNRFRSQVQPWLLEYSAATESYLAFLSVSHSRRHDRPGEPKWKWID